VLVNAIGAEGILRLIANDGFATGNSADLLVDASSGSPYIFGSDRGETECLLLAETN
jgi:hypothetical protein